MFDEGQRYLVYSHSNGHLLPGVGEPLLLCSGGSAFYEEDQPGRPAPARQVCP